MLATLKDKIKKEDSKKEDALGFPENMNYGDRSMMRYELIRIVRVSYLLEYMSTESLGKCYINNINSLFKMIELPYDLLDEYENKMAELKWVEPKKISAVELKKEPTSIAPDKMVAQQSVVDIKKEEKKKMQPILKVVFKLNDKKNLK